MSPGGSNQESRSLFRVVPPRVPQVRPAGRQARARAGEGAPEEAQPSPLPGPGAKAAGARSVGGAVAAARPRMGGAAEGAASAARPHPSPRLTWPGAGSVRVTWCRQPGSGALRRRAGGQRWGPALRSPQWRGRAGCGAPSERPAAAGAGGGQATEAGFPGDQEEEAGGSRPRAPPPPPPPRRAAEPGVRRGRGTELPAPAPNSGRPRSQSLGGHPGLRGAPASLSYSTGEARLGVCISIPSRGTTGSVSAEDPGTGTRCHGHARLT